MTFNPDAWKQAAWRNLAGWKQRLVPAVVNTGYVAVAAGVLWPLLYEARTGDAYGAAMTLMTLTTGLGTNLISEQIRRWKDEANGEPDVARWLQEHVASDAALRAEVDVVLEKLEAVALARATLPKADRGWFEATLHRELSALGSLPRFQASVSGERNIVVQGNGNQVTFTVIEHQEVHLHPAPDPRDLAADAEAAARRHYLKRFAQWCNVLPLAALGGEEGATDDLTLESVYIGLHTESREPLAAAEEEEREKGGQFGFAGDTFEKHSRPLTALEAASRHTRLVLLGAPGSGKSTFARYWLRQLALAGLGQAEPPLGVDAGLLPVFLTLRDLAPRLVQLDVQEPLTPQNRNDLIKAIFVQLDADVRDAVRAPEFAEGLRQAIDSGAAVLVLDGLDEVAHDLRERVRLAVSALVTDCHIQRVLITCRVRSYTSAAIFPSFHSETLAPFTEQHIRDFANRWYEAQPARFDVGQVNARSADLQRAALDQDLLSLAENPMMLTSMAILHQRDIGLPNQRVVLFDQLVDVLLRRWQKSKTAELTDLLKDELRLRMTVERLAFEVHAVGRSADGTERKQSDAGDLSRGAALVLLEGSEYLQTAARAEAFLDYVDQRAGLLVGRGGELGRPAMYSFPHRTLQEYLAGCYLASRRQPYRAFLERAGEGDYWALAAQYGAEDLLYNRRQPNDTLDLAYHLLSGQPATSQENRAVLWSGSYAALVGTAGITADSPAPHGGPGYLDRVRPALAALLASDLTPVERAEAGRSLAILGDHRDEAMTVEGMRFAFVPGGPFRMGSEEATDPDSQVEERSPHTVDLPHFWMGVHPVTNAQFTTFVAAGGYSEGAFWPEAIAAEIWKDGWFKSRYDDGFRNGLPSVPGPFNHLNHPVTNITWYEALAFTRWLNQARGAERTAGLAFGLPSEAEWEKAARGGLRTPIRPQIRALRDGLIAPETELHENPSTERRYPWGNDFDRDNANAREVSIRSTSSIGVFQGGVSLYGCQDLSGNVWEWTRSLYGNYPYVPDRKRENLAASPDNVRVVRGGAFYLGAVFARCALRYWLKPGVSSGLGFRVVASPFFSRL